MKKLSSYILITFVILNAFLPFSFALTSKNGGQIQKNITEAADDCTILSANWDPAGEQLAENFFVENKTTANIVVKSKNCVGKQNVNVSIYEDDGIITNIGNDVWNDSDLYNRSLVVPSDNFTLKILMGEEDCESMPGGGLGFDCDLYFKLGQKDGSIYDSLNKPQGMLFYECQGKCDKDAKLLEIMNNGTDDQPVNVSAAKETINLDKDTYKFLAPIGTEKEVKTKNIGDYVNTLIKTIIGLSAALAVIMIILAGIQQMGNESVFGKTEAKSKIGAAVLGLLIALGSYALLNTINPDLLGKKGLSISTINLEVETEPLLSNDPFVPGLKTTACPEGIINAETVGGLIPVCKSLETKIITMLSNAKVSGINLSGYGFRSTEKQRELRAKNCGGSSNVDNPNAKCNPLTALPGTSRHENGLAVDFQCDKVQIKSTNNKCYVWLKDNAAKSGYFNLQGEPWHWSTDGH